MLFVDFARWVLLAVGLFLVLVVAVLLALFGWLGEEAQEALAQIITFYRQNKDPIDNAFTAVGVVGSAATATLALHRSWYYAERNLPARLIAYLDRKVEEYKQARPALLAAINDPVPPSNAFPPVVFLGHFTWLLSYFRVPRSHRADNIAITVDLLRDELAIIEARKRQIAARLITAHLIKGSRLSGIAASSRETGSPEQRDKNEAALKEFKAAAAIDKSDLDAAELAARQHRFLGEDQPAIELLQRLAEAAAAKGEFMRQARALRLQAEILQKSSREADWNAARGLLRHALDEVLSQVHRTNHEKRLETAKTERLLGEVQMAREKFSASRTALNNALQLFEQVGDAGREGAISAKAALKRLDSAQRDRESALPE